MKKEIKILLILIGVLFFIIILNVHVPYFNYKNETNDKKFDVMTESSFIFKPCKLNEALRLNNRSYSVGVSKLRHLYVLILVPVILILTGIIQQKSWQRYNKLLVHNLSFLYLPKQI